MNEDFIIRSATAADLHLATHIIDEMASSAKVRGTGISKRTIGDIHKKILSNNAVIATTTGGEWAGFIYMDVWDAGRFISHCGLIVVPKWRNRGIATLLKEKIFHYTRIRYPNAKIFGITTTAATMKINTKLGFAPVTFSEIVQDTAFWHSCKSCVHYDALQRNKFKNCFCTAMLFNPQNNAGKTATTPFKKTIVKYQPS